MRLFLTLGRVKSFVGVPGPGGYKIYLTDGERQWVELGGGGAAGNPHGLPRQHPRGFPSESDALEFASDLFRSKPEVANDQLDFHRLYSYAPTGELYFNRSIPLARAR